MAPEQENVTCPAAAVTPLARVTTKTLDANAAVFARADGAVKVQTGVAGQVKPVKVIKILPAADMA